ncbi:MAG TPA: hypothetical protein VMH83_09600 [Candidatus Acidoferrum sp.]|nr:hypothetical protein [Candidatus Acidoferrum sp.]
MRVRLSLVMLLLSLASTASAGEVRLMVFSQPEGAYLTELGSGKSLGITPVALDYDEQSLARHQMADGCYVVDGIAARWASGASTNVESVRLCHDQSDLLQVTLTRPLDYPGLETDQRIALHVHAIQVRQQQALAATEAAQSRAAEQQRLAEQQVAARERQEREDAEWREWEKQQAQAQHDRGQRYQQELALAEQANATAAAKASTTVVYRYVPVLRPVHQQTGNDKPQPVVAPVRQQASYFRLKINTAPPACNAAANQQGSATKCG